MPLDFIQLKRDHENDAFNESKQRSGTENIHIKNRDIAEIRVPDLTKEPYQIESRTMKKNLSETNPVALNAQVNKLKSLKTVKTGKWQETLPELSSESDYRSVLSQLPHNEFEFL